MRLMGHPNSRLLPTEMFRALGIPVLALAVVAVLGRPAQADPDTGRVRVLDCGPAGEVTAVLGPSGFLNAITPFFDLNSNAVLVPLEVTVDGTPILTNPGVAPSEVQGVVCSYVDPVGRFVSITGILTAP